MAMVKQEQIRATVPAGNPWHTEDIEAKAAQLDKNKSQFILGAVDVLMCLSPVEIKNLEKLVAIKRLINQGCDIKHSITLTAGGDDD